MKRLRNWLGMRRKPSVTNATSVDDLRKERDELLAELDQSRERSQEAKEVHLEKKAAFYKFNDKYGRVLAMMDED